MPQNYDKYAPIAQGLPKDGAEVEAIGDTGSIYRLVKQGDKWLHAENQGKQCFTPIVFWRYAAK